MFPVRKSGNAWLHKVEKGNWECSLDLSAHGFSPDPWLLSVAYPLQAFCGISWLTASILFHRNFRNSAQLLSNPPSAFCLQKMFEPFHLLICPLLFLDLCEFTLCCGCRKEKVEACWGEVIEHDHIRLIFHFNQN